MSGVRARALEVGLVSLQEGLHSQQPLPRMELVLCTIRSCHITVCISYIRQSVQDHEESAAASGGFCSSTVLFWPRY